MTTQTLQEQFLQSNSEQTSEILNDYLRGSIRLALFELMQQEVHEFCGPSHARGNPSSNYHSAVAGWFFRVGGILLLLGLLLMPIIWKKTRQTSAKEALKDMHH